MFLGLSCDRQCFNDNVGKRLIELLKLPETHQAVSDPCHQQELTQDLKLNRSA